MNPVDIIRKKRDGGALTRDELHDIISGFVAGSVAEYHMAALLMAIYFKGMNPDETSTLTDVMLKSGDVIDLSDIPGMKVDKHSTGGVGDKVSLIVAPMVASCGVPVPMISGRGLGHTGGTLDKLESIPGFRTSLSIDEYRTVVREVGAVLMGQTGQVAPADKKMYALRDVTGTVESIPLIAGSIMSKKLAEGIDALVLDVKVGNGAFMRSETEAQELATTLVSIGERLGKRTVGFITDMNQPLGYQVGNWCEVVESVECLRGKKAPDLMEVSYVLGGAMLMLGGVVGSIEEGMKRCSASIWSGRAYEKFLEIVSRQGGDTSVLERPSLYRTPRYTLPVKSPRTGYIAGFDTRGIGLLASSLGAGRRRMDDTIDPVAGVTLERKIGDAVAAGESIATVYSDGENNVREAASRMNSLIQLADAPPEYMPTQVLSIVDASGIHKWQQPELF